MADRHEAAYEAARRARSSLALTTWIEEALDFRLRHGDEASLRPAMKAQRELIDKLDGLIPLLRHPSPPMDYPRLERMSKAMAEDVQTSVQRGMQPLVPLVSTVTRLRAFGWILATGGFALGALVGAGGFYGLSRIL